jgi:polyisoprenoid-binding protein YceI
MAVGRPSGNGVRALAGGVLIALTLAACGGGTTPTAATGGASTAPSAAPTAASAASTAPSAAPSGAATRTTAASSAPASAAPATATRAATGTTGGATATARGSATAASTTGTRYAIGGANSKATYKVNETFINQGNRFNTAEGTTTAITGTIAIDKQNPSRSQIGTITVDISKLASDSSQRDNQIRNRWLESSKYPNATFTPKRLEGLPTTAYTDGQELTFKIVGDLTIRTVTKEVTFDTKGKIVGDTFTGTATTKFNMTDFGFDPPDIAGIVKAENGVELVLTIEAKQAQ